MKCAAGALLAFVVLSSTPAMAGPVADAASRAEALQAQGDTVGALDALNEAMDALWDASPLAFRTVMLVDADASAGTRTERTDHTYQPDEKMTIYVEPVGYGYGAPGSDSTIGFGIDLVIENMTGQVLVDSPDLFSVAVPSSQDNRSFGMTLSVVVPFIRPGEYKAVFTVDDQNSDKNATFDMPFTVVLPATGGGTATTTP